MQVNTTIYTNYWHTSRTHQYNWQLINLAFISDSVAIPAQNQLGADLQKSKLSSDIGKLEAPSPGKHYSPIVWFTNKTVNIDTRI
jgi:hypothetical protein